MQAGDRKRVASVIDGHSQWMTVKQLAAQGTSHVRVLSKKKALELMAAVVDDAIRRGAEQTSQADRQQIINDANERFRSVSRIQADSEAVIRNQKELLTRQEAHIKQLENTHAQLRDQLDAQQHPKEELESTAHLQAEALDCAQQNLRESTQHQRKAERVTNRLARRLSHAQETIRSYDQEVERHVVQAQKTGDMIEQLRTQLHERNLELGRVKGLMEALDQELSQARAQSQNANQPESLGELRGQLADIKLYLKKTVEQRNGQTIDHDVAAMLERITEKEAAAKAQMEDRFDNKLSETLDKIGHTLRAATRRAVDRPVEATNLFISKMFDDEAGMESNLQDLDMQAVTAKESISENLDRLKRLRSQSLKPTVSDP